MSKPIKHRFFNTEQFIDAVSRAPALWNNANSNSYTYKAEERTSAWGAVVAEMIGADEWNNLDNDQQIDRIKEHKGRWRNIRDSYIKYTKNKLGKKKYALADNLEFLKGTPVGTRRNYTRTCRLKDEPSPQDSEDNDSNSNTKVEFLGLSDNNDYYNLHSEVEEPIAVQTVHYLPTAPTDGAAGQVQDNFDIQVDADKSYLLSLLPDYKKLQPEEKIDFRIHTLQFFRSIYNKQTNSNCNTPSLSLDNLGLNQFALVPLSAVNSNASGSQVATISIANTFQTP